MEKVWNMWFFGCPSEDGVSETNSSVIAVGIAGSSVPLFHSYHGDLCVGLYSTPHVTVKIYLNTNERNYPHVE